MQFLNNALLRMAVKLSVTDELAAPRRSSRGWPEMGG
jgi:hypothetical protein